MAPHNNDVPTGESPASSRAKIIETAEPLFARQGFAGVGLREVAERVGLGKSSLFHHFPSKVKLYAAVLERVLVEFDRRLAERERTAGSSLGRLHAWADAGVDTLAENPSFGPLLLRSLFEDDILVPPERDLVDAAFDRIIARITRTLEEGMASGEIREISIPHTIQSLIGLTVYPFASDSLGQRLLGSPIYSTEQIRARKQHLYDFIARGFSAP
jgi:TetR/AcrR family transcriptional regulator